MCRDADLRPDLVATVKVTSALVEITNAAARPRRFMSGDSSLAAREPC